MMLFSDRSESRIQKSGSTLQGLLVKKRQISYLVEKTYFEIFFNRRLSSIEDRNTFMQDLEIFFIEASEIFSFQHRRSWDLPTSKTLRSSSILDFKEVSGAFMQDLKVFNGRRSSLYELRIFYESRSQGLL